VSRYLEKYPAPCNDRAWIFKVEKVADVVYKILLLLLLLLLLTLLLSLCRLFTTMYLKKTMLLVYIVSQLFCV